MSRSIVTALLTLFLFGSLFVGFFTEDIVREAHFLMRDFREFLFPLERRTVEIGTVRLELPVADTAERRARGLMFKRSLAGDEGMLFVFERPGRYAIWMKDVFFPLDILWIDEGEVVDIAEDVPGAVGVNQPPVYVPEAAATAVVELPAGFAAAYEITLGETVRIEGVTEETERH